MSSAWREHAHSGGSPAPPAGRSAPGGLSQGRAHFQQQLQWLEAHALGGLDLILEQLDRVLEALSHQDVELAQMVIADDDRVDGRYLEVHQGILSLLALQAPVAGDLRLVAALLHMIKHIERMGDQCVNIAKMIPLSGHEPPMDEDMMQRRPPSPVARSTSPRISSAKTARSTGSTGRSSAWRSRSVMTPTRASGRCT